MDRVARVSPSTASIVELLINGLGEQHPYGWCSKIRPPCGCLPVDVGRPVNVALRDAQPPRPCSADSFARARAFSVFRPGRRRARPRHDDGMLVVQSKHWSQCRNGVGSVQSESAQCARQVVTSTSITSRLGVTSHTSHRRVESSKVSFTAGSELQEICTTSSSTLRDSILRHKPQNHMTFTAHRAYCPPPKTACPVV